VTDTPLASSRSRRRFLRAVGAAGLGLLSGCSNREGPETATGTAAGTTISDATPTVTATPERYDRVVDVVEAGADPDGSESVTPVLEEVAADDTLLSFPPGTYLFDSTWRFEGYSNLGVAGDRATLVPAQDLGYWLIGHDADDFTFAGFTLDHQGEAIGPQVQIHATGGQSVVRDLTVRGFHDSDHIPLIPNVESADASLLVERLRIPDGTRGHAAVFVGPGSVGKLTFADCYLEGCAQGIYGSAHSGPFYVLGGTYVDNNKAAIRAGGGDHGAHIHGVHVRIDGPDPDRWTTPKNFRGLWLREGTNSFVTGCDIELLNLAGVGGDGAIFLDDLMGTATIRNTHIRVDDDAYAIRAQPPSGDAASLQGNQDLPDEHHLTCENVRVTGSADRLETIRMMGRDGSTFRNVVVDQSSRERRGLVVGGDATECTVQGGSWVTGHYPFVVEGERERLAEGSCPVRLDGVERLDATNLDNSETVLATVDGRSYCIDGVEGVEAADDIVIAVSGARDGELYGRRMSTETFRQTYENL
jgi:hypothetical protein